MTKKKGFNKKHLFWIIPLSLLLVTGAYFLFIHEDCVGENKGRTVGTAFSNTKCCGGLVSKAPEGYTGGAWCVKNNCDVVYLTGLEEMMGITDEGIYSVCSDDEGETSVTLLRQATPN